MISLAVKKLRSVVYSLTSHCISLLYPSSCLFCYLPVNDDQAACASCLEQIRVPMSLSLQVVPSVKLTIYALSMYIDSIRPLILSKFHGDWSVSRRLAMLLLQSRKFNFFDDPTIRDDGLLVPIPLHWTRLLRRGFNQAKVMADLYSQSKNIPVVHLLKRKRATVYQYQLSRTMRAKNLANTFQLDDRVVTKFNGDLSKSHVILVDDLCTTGATLLSAAKELLPLKPMRLSAVVICRSI